MLDASEKNLPSGEEITKKVRMFMIDNTTFVSPKAFDKFEIDWDRNLLIGYKGNQKYEATQIDAINTIQLCYTDAAGVNDLQRQIWNNGLV